MKNAFQSMTLGLFAQHEISDSKFIVGGANEIRTQLVTPDGGCECLTEGGTKTFGEGTANETTVKYSSDTYVYKSSGEVAGKEFHWA